ncbi:MAG: lamin tail domain-containing protein [Anaerolineae bacterium]|nr:lamin tail domain-containing protein [Anaerolineae bacterium]
MPYKLIKGQFIIHYPDQPRNGPQPDGDTVKFLPDNRLLVETLPRDSGVGPDFNRSGIISLRFEAVDALELHFGGSHQNMQWAEAARDFLLERMGFGLVTYFPDKTAVVQSVEHHPIPGYILASSIEGNGRIVSFVYTGSTPDVDGADVWVDAARVEQSLNADLLREGHAYPVFYSTLPVSLREACARLSVAARTAGKGFWPFETMTPTHAATIFSVDDVEQLVLWPKVGRRLISFFSAGNLTLNAFDAWLRADPINRDDYLILPDRELGNMHDVVEIAGDTIRMKYRPEDVIILPDGANVVVPRPQPTTPAPSLVRGDIRIIAALVNPEGGDLRKETITILNMTPNAFDLTGWSLADRNNHRFALGGTLDAGAALRLGPIHPVQLANDGGTITLFDAADKQIDQVSYLKRDAARSGWTLVF